MILIPKNRKDEFTVNITEWKSIEPVQILEPDAYILPESILEDEDVLRVLPQLFGMELITDFTPMPQEEI